ncbi:MAG: hypothetical protein MJ238_02585 [Bacilli bacterium]|nr:hypothetical protein [Bacilli bacterium]
MKKISLLSLFAIPLLALCACGGSGSSKTSGREPVSEYSYTKIEPTGPNYEFAEGSVGESLIEINTGKHLSTDSSYSCTFDPTNNVDKSYTLKSKYENVATVEQKADGKFIINTHEVGDTLITAYDADEMLLMRYIVHVRPALSVEQVQKHVYKNIDSWEGLFYECSMTFLSSDPLSGVAEGEDEFESTEAYFTAEFDEKVKLYDFYYYRFIVSTDMEKSKTKRTFTILDISEQGDECHLYYSESQGENIFDIFRDLR